MYNDKTMTKGKERKKRRKIESNGVKMRSRVEEEDVKY